MLRDGQRCLGSHEVVAGVMAMSAHLTQDAGGAHTGSGRQKHHKRIRLHQHKGQKVQGRDTFKQKWNHHIG